MWIKIYVPFKFCVGYGLNNQGIDCDSIPGRDKSFFFFISTVSKLALGPTQLAVHWVPRPLSLQVKQQGHDTNYSPPSSAEFNNAWSYTSTPSYAVMACTGTTLSFTLLNLCNMRIWLILQYNYIVVISGERLGRVVCRCIAHNMLLLFYC